MFEVMGADMRKVAVLDNAYGRKETLKLNGVSMLSFSLPGDDPKAAHCAPFRFVRAEDGQYYRILADGWRTADVGETQYTAEHGIATLVDDLMFGTHILGNAGQNTRWVIEYILARQTVKRWQLGECDFDKKFEYGFESENLLNALFSVPNLFTEKYRWVYDMRTTPWTLHLKKLDEGARPAFYIRAGRNLLATDATRECTDICTRLYLLGFGEGDNQLTIKDVNGGLPYLQSPQAVINRYGLISKVYVDRQFEDAASLKARGQALLAAMQEPQYSRRFEVADLYPLTGQAIDKAEVGSLAKLTEDGTTAFVTGITRNLDVAGDMTLEMSTTTEDIATAIADVADRQRIEQVYSQGATQIYAQSVQANATPDTPAVLNFHIPREMLIINKVLAKISLDRFRSYSKTTSGGGKTTRTSGGGGASTQTSSSGGGGTQTSNSGGGSAKTSSSSGAATYTSESGGGATKTTSGSVQATQQPTPAVTESSNLTSTYFATVPLDYDGAHVHGITGTNTTTSGRHTHTGTSHQHAMGHYHMMPHVHVMYHNHTVDIPAHSHRVSIGNHTHSVDIPAHTHSLTIPAHTHSVTIPNHTHQIELPDHTHAIEQGIFRYGNPTSAKILVNGTEKATMTTERELDLTDYLLGSDGKVPRGSWLKLGILPDDLAYVTIDIMVQGFVQSRGGGTY